MLYEAMLMLRADPAWPVWGWRRLSWFAWRRARYQAVLRATIADWLHNLADYSARDFKGFSESAFWHEGQQLRRRFPELDRLKRHYDCKLAQIRSGEWPAGGVWPNLETNTLQELGEDHSDETSVIYPFEKLAQTIHGPRREGP